MSAAQQIPEGFVALNSGETKGTLAFQNPSNWLKAEATGPMVVGIYEGQMTEPDQYGKLNHKFTATQAGESFNKDGEETAFAAGATVIINTSKGLEKSLKDVEVGTEVCVLYNGQNKIKSGPYKNKMAHSYSILVKDN